LYGKIDHENHRGFIKPGFGYVMEFYVRPSHRRGGNGTRMFRRLEQLFQAHGAARMHLTTSALGEAFWRAMGFAPTGEVSPDNNREVFEKDIAAHEEAMEAWRNGETLPLSSAGAVERTYSMDYSTINDCFMLKFPELELFFREQFEFWGGVEIPSHCFLGDVLNGYVSALLRDNSDRQQIEKIFRFYEELASSDDVEVRNLLQVTLLEYLWDEKFVYKNALEYMLPKTRLINNTISLYSREPC
jgi:hypothetical protein